MRTYLLILTMITFSCGKEQTVSDEATQTEKLPAISEEFSDTPGLVRLEDRSSGGALLASGYLLNGQRESTWTEFSDNGLMKILTTYHQGKKEGLCLEFNPYNQIGKQYFYHSDLLHGDYKEYNSTFVKEERHYEDGKLEGLVKIYYNNQNMMEQGLYKNGVRNGISRWYDTNGKLTIEYEYKNGQLVKK